MNIGIDLDDTITAMPEFFSVITEALIQKKHRIHIITYRDDRNDAVGDLNRLAIQYTQVHLPTGTVDMAEWKRQVAIETDLDIMIDDSPEVLNKLPSKCKRIWLCDRDVFDLSVCIKAMHGRIKD